MFLKECGEFKMSELIIGKCRNCKKYWEISQLKEFIFKVPVGDGFLNKKDLLCISCKNQLHEGLKYQKKEAEKDL